MSNFVNKVQTEIRAIKSPKTNNVNSRDAELNYLYNRVMKFGGEQAQIELRDEINHRLFVDKLFKDAFPTHFGPDADLAELTVQPRNFDCLRSETPSIRPVTINNEVRLNALIKPFQ